MDYMFLFELVAITFFGTVGNCLFKVGVDRFGEKFGFTSFLKGKFYVKALTSLAGWTIFCSLLLNFSGRVLLMAPLSKQKFGVVISLLTPLGLSLSILAGYFVFHESYSLRELAGLGLAVVTVALLAGGS